MCASASVHNIEIFTTLTTDSNHGGNSTSSFTQNDGCFGLVVVPLFKSEARFSTHLSRVYITRCGSNHFSPARTGGAAEGVKETM